jgi:hypothetical protein
MLRFAGRVMSGVAKRSQSAASVQLLAVDHCSQDGCRRLRCGPPLTKFFPRHQASRRVAFDVDREASRTPRAGPRPEDARHSGPAARARARRIEGVSRDRIAVARDCASAACEAKRRLARGADIDVVKRLQMAMARAFCSVGAGGGSVSRM